MNAENKIEVRPIVATRTIGSSWLVDSGLKNGDRIVFQGFQRIRPGAVVNPKEADLATMITKTGKPVF